MKWQLLLLLTPVLAGQSTAGDETATNVGEDLYPLFFKVGSHVSINATSSWTSGTQLALNGSGPVATLDYGSEAAGYPFLTVTELSNPVQVELKYGEQYPALEAPLGDGPWVFQATGSNGFRTETFAISKPGRVESFFLQGGQRWQSIRLLTAGSVRFAAGFKLSSTHLPVKSLPGQFRSSKAVYDGIYQLGGRAVQAACIDAGASPSTWEITPSGALVRGQVTSQSALGVGLANYTLSFSTKIVRGGTGFRVASSINSDSSYFVLTGDYPNTTFVNTNRTLLPPNHLVYVYGWNIVNQTSLTSGPVQQFPLNRTIEEGKWYRLSITLSASGYNVSIDGSPLVFVSSAEANSLITPNPIFGTGSSYTGSWGFGPFQDQVAYIKDVKVRAQNGSVLYRNSMTSNETLAEYSVAANTNPVCLDGAKRDRLVWIGDFFHTCRVVLASSYRTEFLRGTIKQAFEWASDSAPFASFASMSSSPNGRPKYKAAYGQGEFFLVDYQDLFLVSIADYYHATGDLEFVRLYWNQVKAVVSTRLELNDPTTGLSNAGSGIYFLGPYPSSNAGSFLGASETNGTAPSALNALSLRSLIPVARALGDQGFAATCTNESTKIATSLNRYLWSPAIGAYSASRSMTADFDMQSMAFTIRAGIANASQIASMISKLPQLRTGIGFRTGTYSSNSNVSSLLSPFIHGFLLESLFIANRTYGTPLESARVMLDSFWPAMVTQNQYYSGASWEYAYADGRPGEELFTSLSHPWGAAPTYVLPQYVLGVSATSPGYTTWELRPLFYGLGLTHANGTVPTPKGPIKASWILAGNKGTVSVIAPNGTSGNIVFPGNRTAKVRGGQATVVTTIV